MFAINCLTQEVDLYMFDDFFNINEESFKGLESPKNNFSELNKIKTTVTLNFPNNVNKPFFSIVIPTYCHTSSIKSAILSAINQNIENVIWELIIVDNTPCDNMQTTFAYDCCKELDDPRISYIHNDTNIGSGYNWNRGVVSSKGEWIVFLHDDDVLYESALAILHSIIKNHPQSANLGYISNRFDLDASDTKNSRKCTRVSSRSPLIRGYMKTGAPTCGTCILREAYINAGGIDYDFGPSADSILAYNICKRYLSIQLQQPLGCRNTENGASSNVDVRCQMMWTDELFARYRYSVDTFSKIWGKCFSGVITFNNITNNSEGMPAEYVE